ncbi:MAG: DUF2807 domain-containing protein [Bacteroidetes bacterium]|nr:DUF2807 domain-containing protein [Bacteroidota bacterium]
MKTSANYFRTFGLFLLLASLFLLQGCYYDGVCIQGNGMPRTELRSVQPFTGVVSNGSFEVYVHPSQRHEVEIDAESNLLPYIRTTVSGGRLFIETKGSHCINPGMSMIVHVYVPYVESFTLNGSGLIKVDNLMLDNLSLQLNGSGTIEADADVKSLDARISGSGTIWLTGLADYSDIRISGSGNVEAYGFVQKECYASISGSGNMYVRVAQLLDVSISGSGNVYYRGNPAVRQQITGSGRVIRS